MQNCIHILKGIHSDMPAGFVLVVLLGDYRKIGEGQNTFFHGASDTASVKKYLMNVSCFSNKTLHLLCS